MTRTTNTLFGGVILALAMISPAPAHDDFAVGRNNSTPTPQLVLAGDPDILSGVEIIQLSPGSGLLAGYYVETEPGWVNNPTDDAGANFFTLLAGHRVALGRVSFPAGFSMFDPDTGTEILDAGNPTFEFSQIAGMPGEFHHDLIYAADSALWNIGDQFSATFKLTDLAGLHADSDAFTLHYEIVPEPATLTLLALAAAAGLRRRR